VNVSPLPALQADALREVCNICGGYAATALSRLLGDVRVDLDVPLAMRTSPEEVAVWVGEGGREVVAGEVRVEGSVQGSVVLALDGDDARRLSALLGADVMGNALVELTNILASACLNALALLTHRSHLPGVPRLLTGTPCAVARAMASAFCDPKGDRVVLSTTLTIAGQPVSGRLLLVPDERCMPGLLAALGVA
jgi:chemotaxis protein CheY-P-specific phosphatase CheC